MRKLICLSFGHKYKERKRLDSFTTYCEHCERCGGRVGFVTGYIKK